MDYYTKLKNSIRTRIILLTLFALAINYGYWWFIFNRYEYSLLIAGGGGLVLNLLLVYFIANRVTNYVTEPLKVLQQAILHVSPSLHGYNAPNLDKLRIGRELISSLALQVYQISRVVDTPQSSPEAKTKQSKKYETVLESIPMPIIVLDNQQNVLFANSVTDSYLGLEHSEIVGKNVYSILDLSFSTEDTLDAWLSESKKHKATSAKSWERVRLTLPDQKTRRQLDLVSYYNKDNPEDIETVLTIFDRTKNYNKADDGIGFIALAVHELRTPLTMLRGYIEVFEDELKGKLDEELSGYMEKMSVSARQLSDFVSNILNVARIEENQLFLQLTKESWPEVLRASAKDMELRAKVHGKHIRFEVDEDIPEVAVDKISIYEVVNNLLDNAIKYSDKSDEIIVRTSKREDGLIQTTVQDFGIGIPASIIGSLFEKFYRNHRSRAHIGGTGLGLYLSKAIIRAHGGQIWVQSKEGQGSTFGFTLVPYDQIANQLKNEQDRDITRTAHGWIKNHSFYRS